MLPKSEVQYCAIQEELIFPPPHWGRAEQNQDYSNLSNDAALRRTPKFGHAENVIRPPEKPVVHLTAP
jgi:hypothetical protein